MKEKLKQEIKHLKQRIDRKKKVFKRVAIVTFLWAVAGLLGLTVLNKIFESLEELRGLAGFNIGFAIWGVGAVLLIIATAAAKDHVDRLRNKLEKIKKKLNLKNFLDELEVTTDPESKKILVEKILKEVE